MNHSKIKLGGKAIKRRHKEKSVNMCTHTYTHTALNSYWDTVNLSTKKTLNLISKRIEEILEEITANNFL